jgi:hypothetical protein
MRRQLLVAVALAVLMFSAGCSGLLPSETTPTTNETTSGTPVASPTGPAEPLAEYPAGFSADGVTDSDAAINAHRAATYDAGSWTLVLEQRTVAGDRNQTLTDEWQVDHSAKTQLRTLDAGSATRHVYLNETDGYIRDTMANQSAYTHMATGYNASRATQENGLTQFLSGVEYEHTATEERNGTTYAVYTSTGIKNNSTLAQGDNIQSATSSLTVAEDGRITHFRFDATVTQAQAPPTNVTLELTFSDYGSTDAPAPNWLDEAINTTQTDAPGSPTPNGTTTSP